MKFCDDFRPRFACLQSKKKTGRAGQLSENNYSLILSLVTTTLSFDPPRTRAMMIISTTIAPTTHIHGWMVVLVEEVVVVVLEELDELSCAKTWICVISKIARIIKEL